MGIPPEHRLFQLFGKESLAPDLGQRHIQDLIPGGLEYFDPHRQTRMGVFQKCLDMFRLPEGQLAPSGSDDQLVHLESFAFRALNPSRSSSNSPLIKRLGVPLTRRSVAIS